MNIIEKANQSRCTSNSRHYNKHTKCFPIMKKRLWHVIVCGQVLKLAFACTN